MSTEMTPQERFAAIERNLQMITELHLAADQRSEEWRADWEKRATETAQRSADWQKQNAEAHALHDRELAAIRSDLRRAVRVGIKEARAERRKRRELDDKITQLAAAQLITEEKLQRYLESRSSNGHPRP